MKPRNTLLVIFAGVWIYGCAAPQKPRVPAAQEIVQPSSGLQIDQKLLDQKIRVMEGVLASKDASEGDKQTAQAVLNAYQQLKGSTASRLSEKDYQQLILTLLKAMSLMDATYFERREVRHTDDAGALARFDEKRRAIINSYLKRNYQGVIQEALEVRKTFGPDALTREIGVLYALSLAEEGDLQQAIEVGEAVAKELDRVPDRVQLRSEIARWQLQLGRQDRAVQTYEKLSRQQEDRAALVQEVGRRIGPPEKEKSIDQAQQGEPAPGAEPGASLPDEGYTMDELIQKVRSLVKEHAYGKARILIVRERIRAGEGPQSELLDRELENIDQQEAAFQARQQEGESAQKATQEIARRMIEEENYQGAIDTLSEAGASQGLDSESLALKNRAEESLINKERNRAAELFLAARKTNDPSKKKELLRSARAILKGLIDTYPSSPLNPKLKSHMAVVQKELDKLP